MNVKRPARLCQVDVSYASSFALRRVANMIESLMRQGRLTKRSFRKPGVISRRRLLMMVAGGGTVFFQLWVLFVASAGPCEHTPGTRRILTTFFSRVCSLGFANPKVVARLRNASAGTSVPGFSSAGGTRLPSSMKTRVPPWLSPTKRVYTCMANMHTRTSPRAVVEEDTRQQRTGQTQSRPSCFLFQRCVLSVAVAANVRLPPP